jgi:hypothetical protein
VVNSGIDGLSQIDLVGTLDWATTALPIPTEDCVELGDDGGLADSCRFLADSWRGALLLLAAEARSGRAQLAAGAGVRGQLKGQPPAPDRGLQKSEVGADGCGRSEDGGERCPGQGSSARKNHARNAAGRRRRRWRETARLGRGEGEDWGEGGARGAHRRGGDRRRGHRVAAGVLRPSHTGTATRGLVRAVGIKP